MSKISRLDIGQGAPSVDPPATAGVSSTKLAYIDAVRGLAILGVMALHCGQAVPARSTFLQYTMKAGVRGVQLFYIASAITLCMSWHRRNARELRPVRNYFLRRFCRIAPLFYVAIGGYLLLEGWGPRVFAPNGVRGWFVPVTILMVHGWHPETINGIVPGSWSIAVEFTFYLALPIILSFVTSSKRSVVLLTAATAICLGNSVLTPLVWAPRYPENQAYLVEAYTFFNFFSQLPVFAIGVTAFFAIRDKVINGVVAGVLLGISISIASLMLRGAELSIPNIMKHHVAFSAVLAAFVVILARNPFSVFVNPATLFLGKMSYGLYLIHFAVIHFLAKVVGAHAADRSDAQSIAFFFLTLTVSALLALAANRVIEEPGISLGRRLVARSEALASQQQ